MTTASPERARERAPSRAPVRHLYYIGEEWSLCGIARREDDLVEWDGRTTPDMCVVCVELCRDEPARKKRWWQFWR